MRLCVTGASGRLGQAFLASVARERHLSVRALRRPGAAIPATGRIEWFEAELDDPAACERFLQEQDVLVHLAWRGVPLGGGSYAEGIGDGLLPMLRLLDAARGRPGMRIVFPSSGGTVYADTGTRRPHREDDPCFPTSPYAAQKLAAEHYLQMLCATGGVSGRILRISTAYGWISAPDAPQGFIGVALASALAEKPIRLVGDPDNVRDFVHRDDVARALLLAATKPMEAGQVEVLNIGSGIGTSVRDVVRMIQSELGRPVATKQEHWDTARGLPGHAVLDIARAKRSLGWTPRVPLQDGIAALIRGLRRAAA